MANDQNVGAESRSPAPVAATPSGGFWRSILEIFTDPMKVFARVDAGLTWWKPFILVAVVSMALTYVTLPLRRRLIEISLQGRPEDQIQKALEGYDKFGPLSLIAVPITLIIVYLIIAGIVHLVINIMSSRSSFKKTLSLLLYCGLITLVEQIIASIIVRGRGVEGIESAADLTMSFSLAPLFPSVTGPLAALMQSVGVFQIWYYVVLAVGIAAVFKISRKQAIIPVIPVWLISFVMLLLGTKFSGAR